MATFFNQATLTYNDNVVNSNIVTGEIVEVLEAAKTATLDTYSAGDEITYIVSIVNSGATAFIASANAFDSSVFPTPVGPRNKNEPVGRLGSLSPTLPLLTALATADTASF